MIDPMKRLLLAEDDQKLCTYLEELLTGEGFTVTAVRDAESLRAIVAEGAPYALAVLDRLLADTDTKDLIPEIRRAWPHAGILVISAVNTPTERADVINLGADDYLGKPFHSEEFVARLRAMARRDREPAPPRDERNLGKSVLHLGRRYLTAGEKREYLTAKEFLVLEALSATPGKVMSRYELLETVWGNINLSEKNLVEATITNLRKRIAELEGGFEIRNQRGVGYWVES